jgi:hypothetical protein
VSAHERYEELAVGHVLGGLAAADAADFRSHLLGCRDCRLRVAELRDIAADLAAAEREERAEARVRTEVAQRTAEAEAEASEPERPRALVPSRALGVGLVLLVVVLGALAFWNLHLRTQVTSISVLAERQDDALAELATGVSVTVESLPPTSGLVIVDEEVVAFTFVDLPHLVGAERYVVWLLGVDEGEEPVLIARTDERRVAGAVVREGADELLVTVEHGADGGTAAAGREVARADLSAGVAPAS